MIDWVDMPPREKVWHRPEDASFEELLAVLISQGLRGRNVLDLSRAVAQVVGNEKGLLTISPGALTAIRGIGPARAALILAAAELARRQNAARLKPGTRLNTHEIALWLQHNLLGREQEYFYLFSYSRRFHLVRSHMMARGTADQVQVYIREVVKLLLNDRASFAIIAHNHPETSALPSRVDLSNMRKLQGLLTDVGVGLLDQLIAGEDGVYSCRRRRFVDRVTGGRRHSGFYVVHRKIQYANPDCP